MIQFSIIDFDFRTPTDECYNISDLFQTGSYFWIFSVFRRQCSCQNETKIQWFTGWCASAKGRDKMTLTESSHSVFNHPTLGIFVHSILMTLRHFNVPSFPFPLWRGLSRRLLCVALSLPHSIVSLTRSKGDQENHFSLFYVRKCEKNVFV